jgi:putative component of toxin-antitoxin plasmid stabilization module
MEYTVNIFKADGRAKTGERLFGTYTFDRNDTASMDREVAELKRAYPPGYRFEYYEKYKTVKSLMTGQSVKIDADTPWCCNPASESFWSN